MFHNIYESNPVLEIIGKVYQKTLFHRIGISMLRNNIIANLQKV